MLVADLGAITALIAAVSGLVLNIAILMRTGRTEAKVTGVHELVNGRMSTLLAQNVAQVDALARSQTQAAMLAGSTVALPPPPEVPVHAPAAPEVQT